MPVRTEIAACRYAVRRTAGSRGPAFLAPPGTLDLVEVVDRDDFETVLLWDCPPSVSGRLVRRLRTDLHRHDPDEFVARWSSVGGEELAALRGRRA